MRNHFVLHKYNADDKGYVTRQMDKDNWLDWRKGVLTATDVATIVYPKWDTELGVALRKRGLKERPPQTEKMEWGLRLEEPVSTAYMQRRFGDDTTAMAWEGICIERHGWMGASLDYIIEHNDEKWILEVKTTQLADEWGTEGTDQIPHNYIYQAQWQMLVSGYSRVDVAVLINGNQMRTYTVVKDDDLHQKLERKMNQWFTKYIQGEALPDASSPSEESQVTIRQWVGKPEAIIAPASAQQENLMAIYQQQQKDVREAQKKKDKTADQLKAFFKHANKLEGEEYTAELRQRRGMVSWKAVANELRAQVDPQVYAGVVENNTGTPTVTLRVRGGASK